MGRGRGERLRYLISRTKTSSQAKYQNSSLPYSLIGIAFIHNYGSAYVTES